MTLRSATQADARRMAQVHAQAFDRPWSERELLNFMAAGAEGSIGLDEAGFILWRVAGEEAEILTLAVAPSARGKGLGRALLDQAVEAAGRAGAISMFLEVADDNAAAIALYRSGGFEEKGRRRAYYRRTGGEMRDALIFARALNTATPLGLSCD